MIKTESNHLLTKRQVTLQGLIILAFIFVMFFIIFKNVVDSQFVRAYGVEAALGKEVEISKELTSLSTYTLYFDRSCKVSGSLEDRKRVRWVPRVLEYKIFSLIENIHPVAPYYLYVLLMTTIIYASLLLCLMISGINWKNLFLFVCPLLFILSFPLSEINFSMIEMLFISMGLFFSYKKKFLSFLLVVIAGTLNRESGVLIALTWFVFHPQQLGKLIIGFVIAFSALALANLDIIPCFFKLGFFLSLDHQEGQFTIRDVSLNPYELLRFTKIMAQNFLIFLFPAILLWLNNQKSSRNFLCVFFLYFFVFLIFTPLLHISVRLIIIPYFVMLGNSFQSPDNHTSNFLRSLTAARS